MSLTMVLTIPSLGSFASPDASANAQTVKRKSKKVAKRTYRGSKSVARKGWKGAKYGGRKSWKGGRKVVSRTKKIFS